MGLIYITGNSGSGKSSVLGELKKLGFEAHGSDEEKLSRWYRRSDNQQIEGPPLYQRGQAWYTKHDWRLKRKDIVELNHKAKHKIVFLCGVASNQEEMYDLFEKVILLSLGKKTVAQRITSRDNNEFGKQAHELENILARHAHGEKVAKQLGAIPIDATKPLNQVVRDIIAISRKTFPSTQFRKE